MPGWFEVQPFGPRSHFRVPAVLLEACPASRAEPTNRSVLPTRATRLGSLATSLRSFVMECVTESRRCLRRLWSRRPVQRLLLCVEPASFALLRRRTLWIIAVCSVAWLASVWLAATIARAQESPFNNAGIMMTQPTISERSIEKPRARHLVLSMVDRSDLEPSALRNSAAQLTNPHPTDGQNAGKVLLPSNPRGPEYASLAALASAPSSSRPYAMQAKRSGQTHTNSPAGDNKALGYQVGPVNFVINGLPSSFSVSSPGSSLPGAR
jgi:hypothetical protein